MILAGDVGATKILLEVGDSRSGRWEAALSRRYSTEAAVNFSAVLSAFLDEWSRGRSRGQRISAAAFGAAGPQVGNEVRMTNRPWVLDGDAIGERFGIPHVRVVNDLAASAHGIPWLGPRDCMTLQPGRAHPDAARVVLGVGTGLGISYMVPANGRLTEVAGEGGHGGFAPSTLEQSELWRFLFQLHGRVSCESILSGHGLVNVYSYVRARRMGAIDPKQEAPLPEKIATDAAQGNDEMALDAFALFAECLGTVAGDHALAVMARGGVYLTGGIVAKNASHFSTQRFRAAFCAKAPHANLLMRIPVRAIMSERVGLLGAARIACEL